jgi:hypothetical protein
MKFRYCNNCSILILINSNLHTHCHTLCPTMPLWDRGISSVHSVHTSGAFVNSMSCVRIRYRLVATSLAGVRRQHASRYTCSCSSRRRKILSQNKTLRYFHILFSLISFISFQIFFRNHSVGWWRSQEAENQKFRRLLGKNSGGGSQQ